MTLRQRVVSTLRAHPASARALSEVRARRLRDTPSERPLAECLRHIRPGSTAVDVGASLGLYALAFSHAVGRQGHVLALEPNPIDFAKLEKASWHTRIEPLNLAASDAEGTATLHLPVDDRGTAIGSRASLRSHGVGGGRDVTVQCRRLDDVVPRDADVSLVKVDVEGFELPVLAGAEGLLERCRPPVVCEIEQRHLADSSLGDVVDLMAGLGYSAHAIGTDGLIPWAQFDLDRDQRQYVDARGELTGDWRTGYLNNFLFTPRD